LVPDVKKTLLILFLLIISLSISVVYIFKDYGITHGCVIITSGFNNPSRLDSMIARFDNRTAQRCLDPFVIDISEIREDSPIVREIKGIKFFLGTVIPEKKEDDAIVDKEDHGVPLKEDTGENQVQQQVIESIEDSDIAVYLVKDDGSFEVSSDEVEDAVVNIQASVKKVDIIITSAIPAAKEKIIKSSTQLVNITKDTDSAVFTYSVIRQDSGEKVVSLLSRDDFGTLF